MRPPSLLSRRFAREQRLLKAADFERVLARAKRRQSRYFTLLYVPNNLPRSRLGLIVARRQLPKAVARNRFKRLVRESFRGHQDELIGLDIVVLARAPAATLSNNALLAELDRHWPTRKPSCENSSSA